jgi:RND family efflux transporter MFP subunit
MPADHHPRRRARRPLIAVAFAVVTAGLLGSCGGTGKAQDVVAAIAAPRQVSAEVGGLGRTAPIVDIPVLLSAIGLKGTAIVQSLDVQIGQFVTRGQELLTLDPTQLTVSAVAAQAHIASLQGALRRAQAELSAAQAAAGVAAGLQTAVAQASAQVQQAQQQLGDALSRNDQISAAIDANHLQLAQVALAKVRAQADQAHQGPSIDALQSQVQALEGELSVEQQLAGVVGGRTAAITSPIDGQVNGLNVTVGSPAPTSQPLLDVIDTSRVTVTAQVAVADRSGIRPGDSVDITYSQAPVVLHGSVTAISPGADSLGLSVTVVVSAPNVADPSQRVPVGTQAFVHIRVPRQAAVTVPRLAVVTPDQAPTVFVVSGSSVQRRSVVLGRSDDVYAEIVSGVSAGDQVVIVGTQKLDNGSAVHVVPQKG